MSEVVHSGQPAYDVVCNRISLISLNLYDPYNLYSTEEDDDDFREYMRTKEKVVRVVQVVRSPLRWD